MTAANTLSEDPVLKMALVLITIQQEQLRLTKKVNKLQRQVDSLGYARKAPRDADDLFARNIQDRETYRRIRRMIDVYALANKRGRTEVWSWLYKEYGRQYDFNVYQLPREPNVSYLEAIERAGRLDEFCYMVSELCAVEVR